MVGPGRYKPFARVDMGHATDTEEAGTFPPDVPANRRLRRGLAPGPGLHDRRGPGIGMGRSHARHRQRGLQPYRRLRAAAAAWTALRNRNGQPSQRRKGLPGPASRLENESPTPDVPGDSMFGSVVFLVLGVAMGVVFIWDVGGLATAMRARLTN
jgi:hypothetical protein